MVCCESPQPHATVSQAIFQNGEEKKKINFQDYQASKNPFGLPSQKLTKKEGLAGLDPQWAQTQRAPCPHIMCTWMVSIPLHSAQSHKMFPWDEVLL